MSSHGLSVDHVGLAVFNLEAARASFERMGFRLAPRSMHAGATTPGGPVEPWGSGNHCAMFEQGYFEVSDEDIKQFVLANAPAYQHPRKVYFLDGLPLAPTNKVDRRALLQMAVERVSAVERASPAAV